MLETLARLFIALSILVIIFFAYTKKDKLCQTVALIILGAIALGMAISGFVGLISGIELLSFLVNFLRLIADIIVLVEIGLILFLFIMKFKPKLMPIKVAIILYVVLRLLLEFGAF